MDTARCPVDWRYAIALALAPVVVGAFGMLLELALRRTYGRDPLYGLLLTFGAALVHRGRHPRAVRLDREAAAAAGGDLRRVPARRPHLREVPAVRVRVRGASRSALLWLFLEKTPYGSIIKAGAHDSEMVRALGINLARLRLFVFALGVALAGSPAS